MGAMRKAALVAVAVTAIVVPARAQTLAELQAKQELSVGVVVDLAPFGLLDESQQPVGLDVDVANLVGACLRLPVRLVAVTGSNRIPFLLTGKVDMLASALAITPERARQVQFSRPYTGVDNVVVGRRDLAMATVDALAGRTVAVPRSSTQEVALVERAPKTVKLVRFDDQASTLQALLSSQADAMATPETILAQIEAAAPGRFERKFSLFVQKNALAVRPGQPEFAQAVDGCLAAAAGEGRLAALHRKWFKAEPPAL